MTGLPPTRLLGWVSVRPVGGIQVTHFAASGRPAARRLGASTDSAGALGELSREVLREHLLAQKPRGLRR